MLRLLLGVAGTTVLRAAAFGAGAGAGVISTTVAVAVAANHFLKG